MKIFKLLIVFLTIISSHYSFAENGSRTVGNGGDALKCISNSSIENYQMLDWYEGSELRNLNLNLGPENLAIEAKLQIALSRLKRLSPDRAKRYENHLKTFMQETKWLKDGVLVDIPDSDHIAIPEGCKILQIANQSSPVLSSDKRYIIDQNLWNKLDTTQQASLLLHEVIYREAIELGQINSVATRYLNSLILSTEMEQFTVQEFTDVLSKLGFVTNTVQGVEIDLSQYEFHNNGNLKSAKVSENAVFNFSGNKISLKDKVTFYEDGRIQQFTPSKRVDFTYQKTDYSVLPFPVSLYQNGKLQSLMLNTSSIYEFKNNKLKIKGAVKFFESGILKAAVVEKGTVELEMFNPKTLPVLDFIQFFENGNLDQASIDTHYAIPYFKNNMNWTGRLHFNQDGKVNDAFLSETFDVVIQGKKIALSPFFIVEFWNNGKIKTAQILNAVSLKNQDNKNVSVNANSIISLTDNELLIKK